MPKPKTDEFDREIIIDWYQQEFGLKLTPVGRKRKYLVDQNGRRYCFIVAREDDKPWHGIDSEVLDNEKAWTDGILVVAIFYKDKANVYEGSIKPLVQSRVVNFNSQERGDGLRVKINKFVPDFSLEKIGEVPYGLGIKEIIQKARKDPELFKKLQVILGL